MGKNRTLSIVGVLVIILLLMLYFFIRYIKNDEAQKKAEGPIVVSNAFMYAMPPGSTVAAVYLTLSNTGGQTRVLNYVYSPVAGHIEVHRSQYENGIMKMRSVQHTTLDPKTQLVFKPNGYHLMLFDIDKPLKPYDKFELNFEFEGGIFVVTQVNVRTYK